MKWRRQMKINETYLVTERDIKYKDKDVVATIKIIDGEYSNVEFHFGELHFSEEPNEDGTYTMSFNYDILSEEHENLKGNTEFETYLGEILNDLLRHALTEAEKRYKNESGTENTETPSGG